MTAAPRLIVFDATAIGELRASGVGTYASNLLAALTARGDGRRYETITSPRRRVGRNGRMLRVVPAFVPVRSLWMQSAVPRILAQLRPDVCHFTNYIAPTWGRCPLVVTFHDMGLFLHPQFHAWTNVAAARAVMGRVAHRACRIIAVSHSAAAEIVSTLHVPADRVTVVYEAPAGTFMPIADRVELDRVRRKYDLPRSFVLHVGTIEPRKNLVRLIAAMRDVRRRGRADPLVLAGPVGWKSRDIMRAIDEAPPGLVRRLEYVSQADLPALYNLARVVAFPSLYEGFGLPIVEAMACGVPVVTSNRSSMKEIAGDAATLVDPEQLDAIADAVDTLLTDPDAHAARAAAGRLRAAQFSWARAADETVRVYEDVCRA